MRHLLIDTDTASDDVVAILMALRETAVKVEAITVVAGNCPLDTCVKNALITVEKANTYQPPVFAGMSRPLMRDLFTSEFVHGDDGMGNMDLPEPEISINPQHAVDAIIDIAKKHRGNLEIITLGPLTNLAMAVSKEPRLVEWVKHVYVMGGAASGPGNITPVAEFNFYVDAEAVHIFLESDFQKTIIGWEVCYGDNFIGREDIENLNSLGELGQFVVRCNASLIEFNKGWGKDGFDLPDPSAMAVALYPDIIEEKIDTYTYIDYKSEKGYGQFVVDHLKVTNNPANATVVSRINASVFKEKLFSLLS